MKRLIHISCFLCMLLPNFLLAGEMVSIDRANAILYSNPGDEKSRQWKYDRGFPLEISAAKGEWVKVTDFEGDNGWILRTALGKTPHMVVKANKDQSQKINIRKGPGENFDIVGEAVYGVIFETIQQQHGWVNVRHDSGLEGWVKRSFLWGF